MSKTAYETAKQNIDKAIEVLRKERAEALDRVAEIDAYLGSFGKDGAAKSSAVRSGKSTGKTRTRDKVNMVSLVLERYAGGQERKGADVANELAAKHGGTVKNWKATIYNQEKAGKLAKTGRGKFKSVGETVNFEMGAER